MKGEAVKSVLLVGAGVALAGGHALAAGGGLSSSPAVVEQVAERGVVGALSVSNTSSRTMNVTIVPRRWIQSRTGVVSPDRRSNLKSFVRVGASRFALEPGKTRQVDVALTRVPSSGSLYGNLEVVGVPSGPVSPGISVAYRIVSSLRLNPRKAVRRVRVGKLSVKGTRRRGTLRLAVRNTGNTRDLVSATVRIAGGVHTLGATAPPLRIVPGAVVDLPLASLRGSLPAGRYRVSGRVTQGGQRVGSVRGTIRLR